VIAQPSSCSEKLPLFPRLVWLIFSLPCRILLVRELQTFESRIFLDIGYPLFLFIDSPYIFGFLFALSLSLAARDSRLPSAVEHTTFFVVTVACVPLFPFSFLQVDRLARPFFSVPLFPLFLIQLPANFGQKQCPFVKVACPAFFPRSKPSPRLIFPVEAIVWNGNVLQLLFSCNKFCLVPPFKKEDGQDFLPRELLSYFLSSFLFAFMFFFFPRSARAFRKQRYSVSLLFSFPS